MTNIHGDSPLYRQALDLTITTVPVSADQVVSGHPETGVAEWKSWNGLEVGVWDMTPGVMSDIESDEICIIIDGAGFVERTINGATIQQALEPGAIFHLREGEKTLWHVSRKVRKIYFAP